VAGGGSPALGRRSSLTASHGARLRLAATGSEAASAGLPVTAASGQSPGWQGAAAAQAGASRAGSSSTTLAAGPDGNHTVTATATGTSSSLPVASYIAALIGFAIMINAHPESCRPPGPRRVPASLSLASSLFRPSESSSVIRVILNGPGAAILLLAFARRMSDFKFPANALELQVTVAAP
jgi:hypothetical protein